MDQDDPEKRLAELERERLQLIEQQESISSQERQLAAAEANAKWAAAQLRARESGRRANRVGRTRRKWAPLVL
jgi:hypothetical protein